MHYRGLFLADIHIGALDYTETVKGCHWLIEVLKTYAKEEPLDFIILGGDYFDKQFYSNDSYVALALKLMFQIVTYAKKVRFINGTSSHDSEQHKVFHYLEEGLPNNDVDFKIITSVTEETLFPEMDVLYIPEEYIYDKTEYYKEFLTKENHYDYIFGHGMIYEALSFHAEERKGKSLRRKAPVFNSAELSYACKGEVYFGHYHIHTELEGDVFYVGSTFRWIFGEEEEKGFFFLTKEDDTYHHTFVVNPVALKYITTAYGYKSRIYESLECAEEEIQKLLQRKEKQRIDFLRILINIPVGYENPESLIDFLRKRVKDLPGVVIEFKNGYVKEKEQRKEAEENKPLSEERRILLDRNIPEETKIAVFLKLRFGAEIPEEKIRAYLKLGKEEQKEC